MAQQWSMKWFNEFAPIKLPTSASLAASLDGFKFKESQVSDEHSSQQTPDQLPPDQLPPDQLPPERLAVEYFSGDYDSKVMKIAESINALIEETEYSAAVSAELGRAMDQIAELTARTENQRATLKNMQKRVDGSACEGLEDRLARALHTQKILERDLEEYQQAYADLKAAAFGDGEGETKDEDLPARLFEFGHGDYSVYPAKIAREGDASEDGYRWGLVIAPSGSDTSLAGKELVLEDGDAAITFESVNDVSRLIYILGDLKCRMFAAAFAEEK